MPVYVRLVLQRRRLWHATGALTRKDYMCHAACVHAQNRTWKQPSRALQPTIYAMKRMMESVRDQRGIAVRYSDNATAAVINVAMPMFGSLR